MIKTAAINQTGEVRNIHPMPRLDASLQNLLLLAIVLAGVVLGFQIDLIAQVYAGSRGEAAWIYDIVFGVALATLVTFPLYAVRRHQVAVALIAARDRANAQVAHAAQHDGLTGLKNRGALPAALAQFVKRAGPDSALAFVLIDIDGFNAINTWRGQDIGDQILVATAKRLTAVCGVGAMPFRISGDEFGLLMDAARCERLAEEIADDAIAAIAQPFEIHHFTIQISACCGVAPFGPGTSVAEMMRRAELAIREAKQLGAGNLQVYDADLDHRIRQAQLLEEDLLAAVDAGHLHCVFQPYFDLATGDIRGAEVLARWRHPKLGYVPPEQFIVLADKLGAIDRLSDLILDQACQAAQDWPADMMLSFNISPSQFSDATLASRILKTIRHYGIPGERVEVEVTEHAVVADVPRATALMRELSDAGIVVALDDFGTGMSSLSLLIDYPFKKLKIDRSFVNNLHVDPARAAIATGVAQMAHAIGLDVTAEGIERPEEQAFLRDYLPLIGQGFLLGRPQTAEEVLALMRADRKAATSIAPKGASTPYILRNPMPDEAACVLPLAPLRAEDGT